ncbi:ribonuclease-3 [Solimonas aquatica]|uniref:Ribonuclease 3 n=1 Tax=Solimonas aquatica TaxID=489703 RepID=A0A1H9HCC9_9GAMM|nr:ribonuclease III [Solimonas aquatica]SEQ60011.1 ribonuclease-3 [Solimonas aquatica]
MAANLIQRLQNRLAYQFREPALLSQALTHRSASARNNERLEFLGDALVNFVIAEALYRQRGDAEEGALSRLRASLVREETLALLATKLELSEVLTLGESELKSGGFRRHSILADAFEAVLGAIYLDGGFAAAADVCRRLFEELLGQLPDADSLKDAKTRLQEWLQARQRPLPRYEVLSEEGPPHERRFAVRASLADGSHSAEATGRSRRGAEQDAARALLQVLENADA